MTTARVMTGPSRSICFTAAREICRRHARSFYFASFFLPRAKRDAAYAIYAFCRLLDDSVDSAEEGASDRIEAFADALDRIYAGRAAELPDDPPGRALRAFAMTVEEYQIERPLFEDLAHGCRMDLTITRYATWPELETYCYHVAGVVGLIMSRVFGPIDAPTARQAVAMGNAMQLTNILRDVAEDLGRGRIYLPGEDMDRFGVSEAMLRAGHMNPQIARLMQFEVDRARELYRFGAEGLCALANDGSRLTASAMSVIYAGILGALARQGLNPFAGRASLSFWQKIARIPAARRLAAREKGEPLPDVFA